MGLNNSQPEEPEEQQQSYRVEVEVGSYIYSVIMDRYERSMLLLAMQCLSWNCLIVVAVLMTIFDNVNLTQHQTHINPIWITPLAAGAVSATFLSLLAIKHRMLAGPMLVGTAICSTIYLISATILYSVQVSYQWTLALSYVGAVTLLALIALDKKRNALVVILLGLIPILIAIKADGHLTDVAWTSLMIIPISAAAGMVVLGITYTLIAVKQYCDG